MKMAKKREIEAAKNVAAERTLPRPVKVLTIAWHEDDKGKRTVPAINRTFRVSPFEKTCVFVDSAGKEQRFKLGAGELDFTSGMVCVKEEEYDVDGNLLAIHNLSHEIQRRPNMRDSNFKDGLIAWTRGLANSKNAVLSRFNPLAKKRAGILVQWQAMADSPDAIWLDGRCPTEDEVKKAQAEYEAKKAANTRAKATDAPTPEPAGVNDGDGEDFDEFNRA
jgi:hypothetical protein